MLNKKHFFFINKKLKKKINLSSCKVYKLQTCLSWLNQIIYIKKNKFCFYTNKNKTVFSFLNQSRHFFLKNLNNNKLDSFFKSKRLK